MQTVSIISQKGGAGKSTLAIHLAVEAAKHGQNAAIIDLDPQASAASWGDRREQELPVVISAHAARLAQEMERVEQGGGQMLFIDTAPHSDSAALAAARASDLVLVPCLPNIFDIEAAMNTVALLQATDTPFFVVLNGVGAVGSAEADEAEVALKGQTVPVCPARLAKRVSFARSLAFGQVASEFEPDGKAAAEIERLYTFMCEHLHTPALEHAPTGTREEDHVRHA